VKVANYFKKSESKATCCRPKVVYWVFEQILDAAKQRLSHGPALLFSEAMIKGLRVLLFSVCAAITVQAQRTDPPAVKLEIKLFEIADRENRPVGYDWYPGNALAPVDGKAPDAPASDRPFPWSAAQANDEKKTVGTMSGILTDPQFKVVVRALEARRGAKVLASPQGTSLSGSALRLQRPDGWEFQVVPTVNTNREQVVMAISVKQDKGDYAGFELSSTMQVRSGEAAVFGDTFATNDKKNPHKNLLLLVTPTIQP
jgi:hypothetical protein